MVTATAAPPQATVIDDPISLLEAEVARLKNVVRQQRAEIIRLNDLSVALDQLRKELKAMIEERDLLHARLAVTTSD